MPGPCVLPGQRCVPACLEGSMWDFARHDYKVAPNSTLHCPEGNTDPLRKLLLLSTDHEPPQLSCVAPGDETICMNWFEQHKCPPGTAQMPDAHPCVVGSCDTTCCRMRCTGGAVETPPHTRYDECKNKLDGEYCTPQCDEGYKPDPNHERFVLNCSIQCVQWLASPKSSDNMLDRLHFLGILPALGRLRLQRP